MELGQSEPKPTNKRKVKLLGVVKTPCYPFILKNRNYVASLCGYHQILISRMRLRLTF